MIENSTAPFEVQAMQPESVTDLGLNVPNIPWSLDQNEFETDALSTTGEAGPALQSESVSDKRDMSTNLDLEVTSSTRLAPGNQTTVVQTQNASNSTVALQRPNRLQLPEHATEAAMAASMTTVRQQLDELLKRAPSTGSLVSIRTVVPGTQADAVSKPLNNPAQLATMTIENQPITTAPAAESAQTSPRALEVPVLSLNDQALVSIAQKQQNVRSSKKDHIHSSSGPKRKTKGSCRSNNRDVRQKKSNLNDNELSKNDEINNTSSSSEAQETDQDSQTSSQSSRSNVEIPDNESCTLDASATKSTSASKKTRASKGGSSRSAPTKVQPALRQRNQGKRVNSKPKGKATKATKK